MRYAALLEDAFRKQLQKVLDNETTFEKLETGVRLSRKQRIIRNSSGQVQQSGRRRLLREQFTWDRAGVMTDVEAENGIECSREVLSPLREVGHYTE